METLKNGNENKLAYEKSAKCLIENQRKLTKSTNDSDLKEEACVWDHI